MIKGYVRLERAMKEAGISKKELSSFMGVRYATVIDKIKGKSRFTCEEAIKIKKKYFPDRQIEELFDRLP